MSTNLNNTENDKMSKKTTTITFRIDTEIKNELKARSEALEQTISETAKNLLAESLSIAQPRSMMQNARDEAKRLDDELAIKFLKYNIEIDKLLSAFERNDYLLKKYQEEFNEMQIELEKQKNKKDDSTSLIDYAILTFCFLTLVFVVIDSII